MTLPELPRVNKQREAKFSLKFKEWLMQNPRHSCTFEMKDTRGKPSFSFDELSPQQRIYGMRVKSDKGVLIRVQGENGEPDYSYHRSDPAYVVIKYPQGWTMIDIETLIMESKRSKRRSLTHARAKEISILSV